MNDTPPFDRVIIDPAAQHLPFTGRLLGRCPASVPRRVSSAKPSGRRALFVTVQRGAFLKRCPCSPGVVGCGYWVLSPSFQCPFSCSYCFLRFYAPDEPLTVYANLEDAEAELDRAVREWDGRPVRLGTGEFADSLALEPWVGHVAWVRNLIADRPNVQLELKTKSDRIESLLSAPAPPNLAVAWSVNPADRIARDEAGAAGLPERLAAARRITEAGYRVAFHFDPIVIDDGGQWRDAYAALAEEIFRNVPPERVAWISLGTLRFPPRFLERWGRRLRGRREFFQEFLPGPDGKLRYFWPRRREVYRWVLQHLRRHGGEALRVYLCMETPDMWETVLGCRPEEQALETYLASSKAPQPAGSASEVAPSAGAVSRGR